MLTDSFILSFSKLLILILNVNANVNAANTKQLSGPEKLPGLLRDRPLFLKFSFPSSPCSQGEFYLCQPFPSQMHGILILSWPEFLKTSQQLLKISDNFLKTSERCWNYLKMFQPPLSSSEAISKGKILVCCDTVGRKYFQGNWTARLILIMC